MGGQPKTISNTADKLTDLRLQTSSYGVPIPVVFGCARISGNVIDHLGLEAIAHTTTQDGGGGKGGSPTRVENTTYTYSVVAAWALCEGPIRYVGTVWNGKEKTTLNGLGLSLYYNQPYGYMVTYRPDRALYYANTEYVAGNLDLGESGSLPNLSYEVASGYHSPGKLDANPAEVLREILTNNYWGAGLDPAKIGDLAQYSNYCVANGLFISPVLDESKEAAEWITDICKVTNVEPVWSQGILKFIPYGDEEASGNGVRYIPDNTPLYDLDANDFIPDGDGVLVTCTRNADADAFNVQKLEFKNRAGEYNTDVVEYSDLANIELNGYRPAEVVQAYCICEREIALQAAQLLLNRKLYNRNTYHFRAGWKYYLLNPMDIITITDPGLGLYRQPVRVISIEEDGGELAFTVEEYHPGVGGASRYPVQEAGGVSVDYNVLPGNVNPPVIFEPPAELVDQGLELWMALSGTSDVWGGADVYLSYDDATYRKIGTVKARARHGKLTESLLAGARLDTMNRFSVDLSECRGRLQGVSQAEFESNCTLCYIDGEYLSFRDVELTGPNRYRINLMNRGLYNSPIGDHETGSDFVRIDPAIFKYPYKKEDIGKTVYLKFAGFNIFHGGRQNLAGVEPFIYTVKGKRGFESPVPFTVTQSGTSLICEITKNLADSSGRSFYTYELRQGSTWDSSFLIGSFTGAKYTFEARDEGTITYWLKPMDGYGNYGAMAANCVVNVAGLPRRNVIMERTEDIDSWFTHGMYLDDGGWHLKSVRAVGDYTRFGDMFGKPLVRRGDAFILFPIIDLGVNILDETAFYFDKDGNAKLRTVEVIGDFSTFGRIFETPVHFVPPQYVVETLLNLDIDYNSGLGSRVDCEYRTSLDGVAWSGWTSYGIKQFYGRFIQVRLNPVSMDGVAPVVIKGARIQIDVPDVEDVITNVVLPAGGKTIYFHKKFTTPPAVGAFTQDTSGRAATWRISNVTNDSFEIGLLDGQGNPIPGKLIQAIIRGY